MREYKAFLSSLELDGPDPEQVYPPDCDGTEDYGHDEEEEYEVSEDDYRPRKARKKKT